MTTVSSKLLILCRDLGVAEGGVATFVRSELKRLSTGISAQTFAIGARPGENAFAVARRLIRDTGRLRRHLSSSQYDAVQLNPSLNIRSLVRDYFLCRTILRSNVCRTVVVFHGWDSELAATLAKKRRWQKRFANTFGNADSFVVLAPQFGEEAVALGVPHENIHVLTTMFDDAAMADFRQFPLSKSKTILFMARLVEEKGAGDLIEAFAAGARDRWPDWKLVIAGSGPDQERIRALAKRFDVGEAVEFAGYVKDEQKMRLLAEAAIFALPTRYNEGVPISVMEAMAAGCALLTSRAGGLGDVVSDGTNGVVLGQCSVSSIENALEKLTGEDRLREEAQAACHQQAWSTLSATEVVRKLESLLTGAEPLKTRPETPPVLEAG
jgi:glycosyltransferase involved in cell wall biosynthesis